MQLFRTNPPSRAIPPRIDNPAISGSDLVREGAKMMEAFFPNPADRAAAAKRIEKRAHVLMHTEGKRDVGFFLYGVARAAGGHPVLELRIMNAGQALPLLIFLCTSGGDRRPVS